MKKLIITILLVGLTSALYADRLTLIVPASEQASANAFMKANVDPQGGEFTFTSAFQDASGAVFYVCSIILDGDKLQIVKDNFVGEYVSGLPMDEINRLNLTAVEVDQD